MLLLNAGLSLLLGLGLARSLLIAALRTVVQLLLVGMVLKTVFALRVAVADRGRGAVHGGVGRHRDQRAAAAPAAQRLELRHRRRHRHAGRRAGGVAEVSSLLGAQPWWGVHVVIPMAGIVLGNVMNGVSVTLNAFTSGLTRERAAIEAQLELGLTRLQALSGLLQSAIKSGMIPIINQMSARHHHAAGHDDRSGLAGMLPLEAAKYQILVLLLLAGGAGLGAIGAASRAVARHRRARPAAAGPAGTAPAE